MYQKYFLKAAFSILSKNEGITLVLASLLHVWQSNYAWRKRATHCKVPVLLSRATTQDANTPFQSWMVPGILFTGIPGTFSDQRRFLENC